MTSIPIQWRYCFTNDLLALFSWHKELLALKRTENALRDPESTVLALHIY